MQTQGWAMLLRYVRGKSPFKRCIVHLSASWDHLNEYVKYMLLYLYFDCVQEVKCLDSKTCFILSVVYTASTVILHNYSLGDCV